MNAKHRHDCAANANLEWFKWQRTLIGFSSNLIDTPGVPTRHVRPGRVTVRRGLVSQRRSPGSELTDTFGSRTYIRNVQIFSARSPNRSRVRESVRYR